MPFVIPVKAMALTVSMLMCGTMFTTYYFCVHDSAFDYLYLPMDFERGQNRGFAVVNFISPRGGPNFYEEFHGHPLTESSANRRVEIIFADVQGKEENLRESARYRPACFVSDGSHRREM